MLGIVPQLREVFDRRDLLYILTWREIALKYKQSVMGLLWAVLMPIVVIGAGVIVRYAIASTSGTPLAKADIAAVAVKAAPWAFFVAALRFGTNSLIASANLLTKIYLPRLIFPMAAVLSQLFDFVVASGAILILLALLGVGVSFQLLWLPVLLGLLFLLAVSCAILLSAGSLFFRDVKYIVEIILTFAIFFTPVLYEASMMGKWQPLILLNPVAPILEGLTTTVIKHGAPSLPWLLYSGVWACGLLLIALTMFRRLEPYFAESV